MRRAHLVRQRTRIKNQVHAILARNLVPTPPVSDLFGRTGRHWLSRQDLPADERSTVQALLRQLDFHGGELAVVDKELAIEAFADPIVARLMRQSPGSMPLQHSRSWPRSATSPGSTIRTSSSPTSG